MILNIPFITMLQLLTIIQQLSHNMAAGYTCIYISNLCIHIKYSELIIDIIIYSNAQYWFDFIEHDFNSVAYLLFSTVEKLTFVCAAERCLAHHLSVWLISEIGNVFVNVERSFKSIEQFILWCTCTSVTSCSAPHRHLVTLDRIKGGGGVHISNVLNKNRSKYLFLQKCMPNS